MLEVKDLNIIINNKEIIKDLSFNLNKNDKLAIIGEEGNGKSTLLKSLLGICSYADVSGIVNFNGNKASYLSQVLEDSNLNKKVKNYLELLDDDYLKINKLYKFSKELNINENLLNSYMCNLSGGEKVKVNILKMLIEENDILFLDEPTNDLDIETLQWLENFINNTSKPIIYVSHDETLLSKTANKILHLEQIENKTVVKHTFLKISYDEYIKKRINMLEKQTRQAIYEKREYDKSVQKLNRVMQKVEYQQNTISRSDPHGARLLKKKMRNLKVQERKLENVKLVEKPDTEENIKFFFDNESIPSSKIILDLNIDKLCINDNILSRNINLKVVGPQHVCIIGNNGAGKTTLLKEIYKILKNRDDIKVGLMPQDYDEILKRYSTPLDYLGVTSKNEITFSRQLLGNMNFTREEMTQNINKLSNGSKAKLLIAKLVLDKSNVLILDEPTRNVSPLSNPVIRKVLKEFSGTIISVSHDRKYIEEVIDTIYFLDEKGLNVKVS